MSASFLDANSFIRYLTNDDPTKAILATPGLEVINGALVEKAVEHYMGKNIDFIDGYIAVVMERRKVSEIYSYNKKHPARIKTIKRLEP